MKVSTSPFFAYLPFANKYVVILFLLEILVKLGKHVALSGLYILLYLALFHEQNTGGNVGYKLNVVAGNKYRCSLFMAELLNLLCHEYLR